MQIVGWTGGALVLGSVLMRCGLQGAGCGDGGAEPSVRSLVPVDIPFGVNLFAPPGHGAGVAGVPAYAEMLSGEAERGGAALGQPRWDDDR